jgi:hypothetical protein
MSTKIGPESRIHKLTNGREHAGKFCRRDHHGVMTGDDFLPAPVSCFFTHRLVASRGP